MVSVQILEFSAGEHPAVLGGFTILRFGVAGNDPVVFLESLFGGVYVERPEGVRRYIDVFDEVLTVALTKERSCAKLQRRLKELSS